MRRYIHIIVLMLLACTSAFAQGERRDVRRGNYDFDRKDWRKAAVHYGTAVARDTTSYAAQYNLASALYRLEDYQGATQAMDAVKESVPANPSSMADYHYNRGNLACQAKDWSTAVQEYRQALLIRPGDLDAKENYIYAKKMLRNQQGGGGGQDDQQDQNDDQNQDQQNQNQDQNQQDQNQDQQNQDKNDQDDWQNQGEGGISRQQAQQMLKAIQAEEKKTQDKVNKEKAAALQSRQKEKNW